MVWPTSAELATASELVFIARIDAVRPLSQNEAQFLREGHLEVPVGTPFRYPTASAAFSLIRDLKGRAPAHVSIQGATDNCSGISLEPGSDYLIFASTPGDPGGDIVPVKGSFKLDDSPSAQAELRKVETQLLQQTPAKP